MTDIKDRLRRYDISHVDVHRAVERIEELETEETNLKHDLASYMETSQEQAARIEELEAELKASSVKRFFDEVDEAVAAERDRWIREIPKHIRQKEATEAIIAAIRGEAAYEKENET